MSRFRDIAKGTAALTPIEVPYGETPIRCRLRPITGDEEAEAHAEAVAYAKAKGIEAPTQLDPAYDLGLRAAVVFRAAMTMADPPVRYFESGAEIVAELDRDRIAMLFEAQERWQAHASPRPSAMTDAEFSVGVVECAKSEDDTDGFLARLRPILRASFTHTLAALVASALLHKSASGSSTSTASPS